MLKIKMSYVFNKAKKVVKKTLDNPRNIVTKKVAKHYYKNKDKYKYNVMYYHNRVNSSLKLFKTRIGILNIELSGLCNLKCRSCPLDGKRKDFMSVELFEKILNEILSDRFKIREIALFNGGESLLNPNFGEILKVIEIKKAEFAKKGKRFLWVNIITNATVLDKWEDAILNTNALDEIRFSIDGGNKKDYEYNRRGSNWEMVIGKVNHFLDRNKRIKTVVESLISPDAKKSKEFLEIINKVDQYMPRLPHNWDGKQQFDDKINELAQKGNQYNPKDGFCDIILNSIVILADGRVSPCCVDINARGVLGDVKKEKFLDIYYNKKRIQMLKSMKRGRRQDIELCRGCGVTFG